MVLLIAPFESMKRMADTLVGAFDIPIKTVVGNLQDSLEHARSAVADGRIIVSRGGTAKLIHDTLGIEVIDIGISQFELLRVLKPFIGVKKHVAVVGFRSLTEHVEHVCTILDIPITCLPVDKESEVESQIQSIADLQIDCLIGDMIAIRTAKRMNAELHLIESDEYAISEALAKAALIAKRLRMQRESEIRIEAVFNSVQEAIIAVDRKGIVDHANLKASELLGRQKLRGASFRDVAGNSALVRIVEKGIEVSGNIEDINGKRVVANTLPFVVDGGSGGAVVVLQEVGRIQALEKKVRNQLHAKGLVAKYRFRDIFTEADSMRHCIEVARQYARTESNIVIFGETGTGKELLAQSIHNESPVRDGPFVAVNCGALPPSLLESELFGYSEGAFTGAVRGGKAGLFELAHCGTIFLDEINELDFQLQSKLLRVLQEREVMRVGDTRIIPVSVRVIVASNVPLREEMEKGRIRKDLYYRLNVLEIAIPPLRERKEDVLLLAKRFIDGKTSASNLHSTIDFPELLAKKFREYPWPGNVRELENISERFVVLHRLLGNSAVPLIAESLGGRIPGEECRKSGIASSFGTLEEIECRIIREVFEEEGKNLTRTAKRLGIDRQTVRKRILDDPPTGS